MKSQRFWIAPTTDLCKQRTVAKKEFKVLVYLYLRKLMCHTHFAQDQFFYHLFLFWSFVSQSFRNHLILWRSYVIHLSNTLLLLFSWLYLLHSSKTCIYLFLSSWPPVFWNLRKKVLHWFISLRMDPSINAWQRLSIQTFTILSGIKSAYHEEKYLYYWRSKFRLVEEKREW